MHETDTPPRWQTHLKYWLTSLVLAALAYGAYRSLSVASGKAAFRDSALPQIGIEQAFIEGQRTGKPLLLNFSAYWCSTCRRFDSTVLSSKTAQEAIREQVIFTRMEWDEPATKYWLEYYSIKEFPTLLLVDGQGQPLRRLALTFNDDAFIQQLEGLSKH